MAEDDPRPRWRRALARTLLALLASLALLLVIMLVKMWLTPSRQLAPRSHDTLAVDEARAVEHLREAIRVRTISPEDPAEFDAAAFLELHALLARAYPRVHATLEREVVNDYSLMYRWPGSDPAAAPIILAAHLDVVPAANTDAWTHPPFAAELDERFVWGRGTMDDKGSVIALFEAAEAMLEAGITPRHTVYLCFGHDEELYGEHGAKAIAARLRERGVEAAFALDEGTGILVGMLPGLDAPAAMVGLAEKGVATIELRVETAGGHASSPPRQTAIGILAAAIARLEDNPMPAHLDGPFRDTLATLGPEMRGPLRLVTTNLWLLRPLVTRSMAAKTETASGVRTTTAVTVIEGGVKSNVLPGRARALVNHRINYGDTLDDVLTHVRETIDDPRVEIELLDGREVSRLSSAEDPAFELIARSLRETYPEVVVAPGLFVAAADARHYEDVAAQVYRQSAFFMAKQDIPRYHGLDERLALDDFRGMIQFYARIMQGELGL